MDLHLQPLSPQCSVSGRSFEPGDRIASYLMRDPAGEVVRRDVLASEESDFLGEGFVFCRWIHLYKAKPQQDNAEQLMKLTAENLFLALADPSSEPSASNIPLIQFLSLMLERKRILKPRGFSADQSRQVYEHVRTHQTYEVPVGTFDPQFFASIQEQLGILTGRKDQPVETALPTAEEPG